LPADQAERAAATIEGEEDLFATDAVIAESAYVLISVQRMPRTEVVDRLIALVQRQNISTFALDKDAVLQGLLLCRPSARVSFADAMVWAAARSAPDKVVYTFDRRFPTEGIEVRRPGLSS
jgi:predicted nucleic acid-binding protein